MATIPLAPALPDINSSANIAFSRWNEMLKKGQDQFADYLATLVRLGQIGCSDAVSSNAIQITSQFNVEIKTSDVLFKIGEFLYKGSGIIENSIPVELRDYTVLILAGMFTFSFTHSSSTVTGIDGSSIPVESNYDSVSNVSVQYGLLKGSDIEDYNGEFFETFYCFDGEKYGYEGDGRYIYRLAKHNDTVYGWGFQNNISNLNVYQLGINGSYNTETNIDSELKIIIPFAILCSKTSPLWLPSTTEIKRSVNVNDWDLSSSLTLFKTPDIYDQIVSGNSGISNVVNDFPIKTSDRFISEKQVTELGITADFTASLEGEFVQAKATIGTIDTTAILRPNKLELGNSNNSNGATLSSDALQFAYTSSNTDKIITIQNTKTTTPTIKLSSGINQDQSVNLDVVGNVTVRTDLNVDGEIFVTDNITASGSISADDLKINYLDVKTEDYIDINSICCFRTPITNFFGIADILVYNNYIVKNHTSPYLPSWLYMVNISGVDYFCINRLLYTSINSNFTFKLYGMNSGGYRVLSSSAEAISNDPLDVNYNNFRLVGEAGVSTNTYLIIPIINKL